MLTLVKYTANCADEFDVHGFRIVDEKWMDKYDKIIEKSKKIKLFDILEINHSFGSNEEIVFDSVKELKDSFTITQITHEVVAQLKELFHSVHGKFFDVVERLEYILEEDFGE